MLITAGGMGLIGDKGVRMGVFVDGSGFSSGPVVESGW